MPKKFQKRIVLDAWAVLALIFKEEPAAGTVKDLFEKVGSEKPAIHISWINLGEVFYNIARKKDLESANEVINDLLLLPIKTHEPSKRDIMEAARFKSTHRLSYADAFAVTLAEKLNAAICTGDPEILAIEDRFTVLKLSRD